MNSVNNFLSIDYTLPKELIAQRPAACRSGSRLLVLEREGGRIQHRTFPDLLEYLKPGDALFVNDTRVIPARLRARRKTGKAIELLLVRERSLGFWEALVRHSGRLSLGEALMIGEGFSVSVGGHGSTPALREVWFDPAGRFWEMLELFGEPPLPPYINRRAEDNDRDRYQTIYASQPGAVAAPTAGLHFDEGMLKRVESKGVLLGRVTLHVGYGTFQTLREEHWTSRKLHEEFYEVSDEASRLHHATRTAGGRVFVCGTSTLRALESAKDPSGRVRPSQGWTTLFIYPPYSITTADALITNFHLPRSSLLCLVSAFAGTELILEAYREAVRREYRFWSYGDAMLIL